MRDISRETQISNRRRNGPIVELLTAIDLMSPWNTAGVEMPDPLDIVADRPDHVALHDLHVVDVKEQFHPRRIHPFHHRDAEGGVIALISRMIDPAIEE